MRAVFTLTRKGLGRAWSARALVALVWFLHLVLALAAAFPFWRVLDEALGPLPEADVLGTGLRLGVLAELAELRPGLVSALGLTVAAAAVLGLLVGAAVSGGVLEALRSADPRPLGHRFGRGAGRFFGRFAGLTLLVGVLSAVMGGAVVYPFVALARSYFREGWGPGRFAPYGAAVAGGLLVLLALLVLDAARIHIVRADAGAWAGLRAGLGLVFRHPALWIGTWLANAVLITLCAGLFVLFRESVPTGTTPLLIVTVLAQQTFALVRTGFRVALLASESALAEDLLPVPAPRVPTVVQSDSLSVA